MSKLVWWPEPSAGDIVWCRFPDSVGNPKPKARPALVLVVFDDEAPRFHVKVAYGTSQRTDEVFPGEFVIQAQELEAYKHAGLSYPTKFNLKAALDLPYDSRWFEAAPGQPFGPKPKLGVLHPTKMKDAARANQEAQAPARKK